MKKIVTIVFLALLVLANEKPALLKSVENNSVLHMSYKQVHFTCVAYGVETLDMLVQRSDTNTSCQQKVADFRENNPKEKNYAVNLFHVQQQYGVRSVENRCLLLLSFAHSYSEELIEMGYARIDPLIKYESEEILYRFSKALKRAKREKNGIWKNEDMVNCFLVPKK